jgi:hypothetical protein
MLPKETVFVVIQAVSGRAINVFATREGAEAWLELNSRPDSTYASYAIDEFELRP